MALDPGFEIERRLSIVDDCRTPLTPPPTDPLQHELTVGKDDLARFSDDAKAIAVAIKSETDLAIAVTQGGNEILQISGHGRIGMMVGERTIDIAKQLGDVAAEPAVQLGRRRASNAIAAVDCNLQRTRERDVVRNPTKIFFANIFFAIVTRAAG